MSIWKSRIIIASLLTVALPAIAQQPTKALSGKQKQDTSYLATYWFNGVDMLKAPLRWKGEDWVKPATTILITGVTVTLDEPLGALADKWDGKAAETFYDAGDVLGGIPFQFAVSTIPMAVGAMAHKPALVEFGKDNLQAQFYAGAFAFVVKELTHRARPDDGEGGYAWYGPFKNSQFKSFYSGHTTLAFATATMIFLHSGRKWWVGAITYTLASGVGISRMVGQQHWASDVVAGAVMGTAVSSFVYYKQEQRRKRRQMSPLKTLP